jgi:hypothetical protein
MSPFRLALICFAIALLWALQALANEVELRVETVLATNSSSGFDPRLNDIRPQLMSFHYSSYRLVQEERRRVRWGKQADFFLPGGRFLQVVPKEFINQRIALQIMLMEGTTPTSLMNASLSFPNNGTVFFGGRRHHDGVLIIRIGAAAKDDDEGSRRKPHGQRLKLR